MFNCLDFTNLQNNKILETTDIDYSLLEDSCFDIKIFDIDLNDKSEIFDLIYIILTKNSNTTFKKIEIDKINNKLYFYFNGDFKEPDFVEMRIKTTDHHFSKLVNFNSKNDNFYSLKEIVNAINLYVLDYKKIFNEIKKSFEEDTKNFEFILKEVSVDKIKVGTEFKEVIVFSVMRNDFISGRGFEKKWFHSEYLFNVETKQFIKEEVRDGEETYYKQKQIVPYFYKHIDRLVDIYKTNSVTKFLKLNLDLSENFYLSINLSLFKSYSAFDKDSVSLNYFKSISSKINPNNKIIYDLQDNTFFVESFDYSFNKNILDLGGPEIFFDKVYVDKNILDEKFHKYLPDKENINQGKEELFKKNLEKKSFIEKLFNISKIKRES